MFQREYKLHDSYVAGFSVSPKGLIFLGTLYTVTHATVISDVPPSARSKIPHEEKVC